MASKVKATFEETAAFLVNHGAGHNADMNHAGNSNGYDETGKYQQNGAYVPGGVNVMAEGNTIIRGVANGTATLQSYITSPVNQQAAKTGDFGSKTISIKAMYIHRFGNNDPNAKLPTEQ